MSAQANEATIFEYDPQFLTSSSFEGGAAIFIVSESGTILQINDQGRKLLNCSNEESDEIHISQLLPLLNKIDLLEKGNERVNTYLRFLSRIGHHFKVTSLNDKQFSGELFFSDINHHDQHLIMIMLYPVQCE